MNTIFNDIINEVIDAEKISIIMKDLLETKIIRGNLAKFFSLLYF